MGRDHLGDPEVDVVILLKCHSKKLVRGKGQDSPDTWDMWLGNGHM
jgi:hypothetical protein